MAAGEYRASSTCGLPPECGHLVAPVGQLVRIGERGEVLSRFCSGANIINGRYFLTAGHCISDDGASVCHLDSSGYRITEGCVVNFGFEHCGSGGATGGVTIWGADGAMMPPVGDAASASLSAGCASVDTRMEMLRFLPDGAYSRIQRVADHGPCGGGTGDYAVLELEPSAAVHGSLPLYTCTPGVGQKTMIVHHPEGYPKQYGAGAISSVTGYSFVHSAHTKGGSSGAPVIAQCNDALIGVHVSGLRSGAQTGNTAVRISNIVATARAKEARWASAVYRCFGLTELDGGRVDLSDDGSKGPSSGCW